MACIGSTRLCVRVQDKLCQLGQSSQARRNVTTCVRNNQLCVQPLTRNFIHDCQKTRLLSKHSVRTSASASSAVTNQRTQETNSNVSLVTDVTKRLQSTMRTQQPGSLPEYQIDPYHLLGDDLKDVFDCIRYNLRTNTYNDELHTISTYYFDGQGKALRPVVSLLMARALNYHLYKVDNLLDKQRDVSCISEMIHTASLVHDDVIDSADRRRGKPSVNVMWNNKKVAMAGDYILGVAAMMISQIQNDDVTIVLSQVMTDIVQGELMQLGSKETENERFAHYLMKTYRKTGSLIANSMKSVAVLSGANEEITDVTFQYGRNLGLAFQLVDDLLDFVSTTEHMGKPAAADLKLGLATAPVLFACEKYPELNPMIMRRFQEPGDCERAFDLVHKSQGLEQTRFLAKRHCLEAARLSRTLADSPYQKGLTVLTDLVLNRMK